MHNNKLPGPESARQTQQHPCSRVERTSNLIKAIPEKADVLTLLRDRHILTMKHMDADLLRQLCLQAAFYEFGELGGQPMSGRILSNLYLDRSREHTYLAFNSAWQRLGGSLLNLKRAMNEIAGRRNALDEFGAVCSSYSDIAVLRTPDADSFAEMLEYFRIPVINGGNGEDEHPSHAMTDLYTLFKWRPQLMLQQVPREARIQIAIGGDPSRTPTLRSFLYGLAQFPQAVERILVLDRLEQVLTDEQQAYLAKAGLSVESAAALHPDDTTMAYVRKVLPDMDLVYLHYLQPVHATRMDLLEGVESLKPEALVLNPQIHSGAFSRLLNNSPHNGYFAHARGGVYMRMALFQAILGQY